MTAKKHKSTFVKNVISRRSKLGWSAMVLAEKAKIPYPTLRDIEAGINNGRPVTQEAIARALSCTVDDLNQESSASNGIQELALVIAKQAQEIEALKMQVRNENDKSEFSHFPSDILEGLRNVTEDDYDMLRASLGISKKKIQKLQAK